jgi:hypothetical protein
MLDAWVNGISNDQEVARIYRWFVGVDASLPCGS